MPDLREVEFYKITEKEKMEYNKEDLLKEAIKKLGALDDLLKTCQEMITAMAEERKVIRYLLFLSCEKDK